MPHPLPVRRGAQAWPDGEFSTSRTHGNVSPQCGRHEGRSLNAWRVNLASRGVARPRVVAPKLVELVPAVTGGTARAPYVLHIAGVELEIGDDFDEQSLRRLVGLLKSC